jgi:hypothetical protein
MALTRKMLKAMGIEEEKIDQIIEAHTETVDALKERADANANAAKNLADLQKELDKARKDLETAEKDGYKKKYEDTKKEFDDLKNELAGKELRAKKVKAYREILKDAGLSEKGIEKAVKYAEWDKIELDEKDAIKDSANHIKTAKEEWAEYVVTTQQKGANPANPPKTSTSGAGKTKDEILAIKDGAERRKAMAENPELFGIE